METALIKMKLTFFPNCTPFLCSVLFLQPWSKAEGGDDEWNISLPNTPHHFYGEYGKNQSLYSTQWIA